MQNQTITKPGYKFIPHIGEIPEDWEVKELGKIGEFKTSSVDKVIIEGEKVVNLLNYMDVYKNRLINNKIKFTNTSVKDRELESCNLLKGDILFTPSSETPDDIGHSSVVEYDLSDTVYSYHLMRYRLNDEKTLDNLFRGYVFNNQIIKKEFSKRATGSTRFTLSKKDFEETVFAYPKDINEQNKIGKIINTCDSQIETTKQIIQKIELRNKGLQQQLLTGKKRLPGFSEKWSLINIGDFSKEISMKNKNDNDLIVLSCTKYDGLVPSLEYFGRKIYSDNLTTYKIVQKNTFAYATNHIEEGSIGYQNNYDEALISPMYTVFKTYKTVDDNFLFRLFKTPHMIYEYQVRMEGSIDRRGGLRWKDFSHIKIKIPKLEEQKAISDLLDKATEQLNEYKEKLEKLELQKKGLMQQLLTGKTRVKV